MIAHPLLSFTTEPAPVVAAESGAPVWHPLFRFTNGSATPIPTPTTTGGGGRTWHPLLNFDEEEKRRAILAAELIAEESELKRERAKARKLERDLREAESLADMRALQARVMWAFERAEAFRREEDEDDEIAIILALLN